MSEVLEKCRKIKTIKIISLKQFQIKDDFFEVFYKISNKIQKVIFSANIEFDDFKNRTKNLRENSEIYVKLKSL